MHISDIQCLVCCLLQASLGSPQSLLSFCTSTFWFLLMFYFSVFRVMINRLLTLKLIFHEENLKKPNLLVTWLYLTRHHLSRKRSVTKRLLLLCEVIFKCVQTINYERWWNWCYRKMCFFDNGSPAWCSRVASIHSAGIAKGWQVTLIQMCVSL